MPETVSLKEVLRKAIEEDDKRDKEVVTVTSGYAQTDHVTTKSGTTESVTYMPMEEGAKSEEMSFVEQAGQLIPWEGK